jgi:hypothetical protein
MVGFGRHAPALARERIARLFSGLAAAGQADPPSVTRLTSDAQARRRSSNLEAWMAPHAPASSHPTHRASRTPHSPDHHQRDKPALCRGPGHSPSGGARTEGQRALNSYNGSSWIFEPCLTWANALQRVQRSAFSLVSVLFTSSCRRSPTSTSRGQAAAMHGQLGREGRRRRMSRTLLRFGDGRCSLRHSEENDEGCRCCSAGRALLRR